MSFIDATVPLLGYSPFLGASQPLRSTPGTGEVPRGFQAEIIDGQYYPDRPLPLSYRPLEDPYASSVPLVDNFQDNFGSDAGALGAVANLYANQGRYLATVLAGRDSEQGLNIRA